MTYQRKIGWTSILYFNDKLNNIAVQMSLSWVFKSCSFANTWWCRAFISTASLLIRIKGESHYVTICVAWVSKVIRAIAVCLVGKKHSIVVNSWARKINWRRLLNFFVNLVHKSFLDVNVVFGCRCKVAVCAYIPHVFCGHFQKSINISFNIVSFRREMDVNLENINSLKSMAFNEIVCFTTWN